VLLTVLAALLAALLTELAADSAELLTLVRPSDALDWTLEAASPAFSFAAPAASEVVEALRRPARRTANRDWRTSARDTAKDIVMVRRRGWAMEVVWTEGYHRVGSRELERFFPNLGATDLLGAASVTQHHHIMLKYHSPMTLKSGISCPDEFCNLNNDFESSTVSFELRISSLATSYLSRS